MSNSNMSCNTSASCSLLKEIGSSLFWKSFSPSPLGRTSDGGNWNHSVSLPIILIKIKGDQMLPSSYISSLLVSIL